MSPGDVTARLTGSAPVPEPIDAATSREALASARSGHRLADLGVSEVGPASAVGSATASTGTSSRSDSDVGVAVLGGSLLTVGVVGLAVSWYFWTEVDPRGQEINRATNSTELTDRQRTFNVSVR